MLCQNVISAMLIPDIIYCNYSITIRTAPLVTASPATQLTALTIPDIVAVIGISIFIDSRTITSWPSVTLSPSFTFKSIILPAI